MTSHHCTCGKIKPKLVQKSFLRKSQDLHLDAVPTTYAKRSLRKRGSHTQALRFGTAQPFWTLSQRCCSNKNTRTKANKQEIGLNHVAVLDYFFAVFLALSQINQTAGLQQSFKHSRSEDLSPKNFLSQTKDRQQRHCGRFCPPQTTSTHFVISP